MIGWAGNFLIVIGMCRIADKHRDAFLWSAAGELLYVYRSVALEDYALLTISAVFIGMALRSYDKWGRA